MINLLNKLELKHLNFKLGEEQKQVLLSIFNFILDKNEKECTLDGFGGSGKSTITKLIIEFLEDQQINFALCAPTHKAKNVLSNLTNRDVFTIHQLLTLKPSLDVMELDFSDLSFSPTSDTSANIPYNGVLIIDECSMINEYLFDFIINKCNKNKCKVLFIGDYAQICPVKDKGLSKAFTVKNIFKLTKVYRQVDDSPLVDILFKMRKEIQYSFNNIISDKGSLYKYDDWKEFILNNINSFSEMVKNQNPNNIKLIAYTNKRVQSFNKVIRKQIFKNLNEYNVGDILMAYDSAEYRDKDNRSENLVNSNDYVIKSVTSGTKYINGILTNGFYLQLYSIYEQFTFSVYVLSVTNDYSIFTSIASDIETIRLDAINCPSSYTRKQLWVKYFKLMSSFLTPIDLVYQNKIIKKKSLDYGYAITAHKCQGSTYDNILIDMGNIFKCYNLLELRQLQYVSMSRTKNNIHLLI